MKQLPFRKKQSSILMNRAKSPGVKPAKDT